MKKKKIKTQQKGIEYIKKLIKSFEKLIEKIVTAKLILGESFTTAIVCTGGGGGETNGFLESIPFLKR